MADHVPLSHVIVDHHPSISGFRPLSQPYLTCLWWGYLSCFGTRNPSSSMGAWQGWIFSCAKTNDKAHFKHVFNKCSVFKSNNVIFLPCSSPGNKTRRTNPRCLPHILSKIRLTARKIGEPRSIQHQLIIVQANPQSEAIANMTLSDCHYAADWKTNIQIPIRF